MISHKLNLERYEKAVRSGEVVGEIGKITQVTGFLMRGFVPGACVGSVCEVHPYGDHPNFLAEVVGFENREVLLMPLGEMRGVGLGAKIVLIHSSARVAMGPQLLGRVIDGLGNPIDGKGDLDLMDDVGVYGEHRNPLERPVISEPLELGIRSIDGLLTVGRGQRVAILAGSGVGKSVLLGMIARSTKAQVNVIALIGERGREVKEFIEHNLGEEGLRRTVLVVATSDQSPLMRMRGAFVASAVAEYFSSSGNDVLLMMDSVTRFAMAQREIGLNIGEPPAQKGYTPSVFSLLPKLLERAGNFAGRGSITGLYSVLVEGDDMDEPIADAVRSIVDGHIVMDRKLAQRGHYPAIDILQSISRVMVNITIPEHVELANRVREHISVYREAEDLINIGAYKKGANPSIDKAIEAQEPITRFLRQGVNEKCPLKQTIANLAFLGG